MLPSRRLALAADRHMCSQALASAPPAHPRPGRSGRTYALTCNYTVIHVLASAADWVSIARLT
jgi:hypothetical protein